MVPGSTSGHPHVTRRMYKFSSTRHLFQGQHTLGGGCGAHRRRGRVRTSKKERVTNRGINELGTSTKERATFESLLRLGRGIRGGNVPQLCT